MISLQALITFNNLVNSKPPSPETESNTPNLSIRVRNPLFRLFKTSPRKEVIHSFGILGVVDPPSEANSKSAGHMTTDFAAWAFFISHMKGYTDKRSIWRTIRPIDHLFPDRSVAFGNSEYAPLQLPLPSTFGTDSDNSAALSASEFSAQCLLSLRKMAQKVKPREKLVLFLIGHGSFKDRDFQFLITTQSVDAHIPGEGKEEVSIIRDHLEAALKSCRGDVLIICNARYSRHLVSEHWTFLCPGAIMRQAANPPPSFSGLGHFTGTSFTACLVEQVAHEYGLRAPLLPPTDEPRIKPISEEPSSSPPPSTPSSSSSLPPCAVQFGTFSPWSDTSEQWTRQLTTTWSSFLPAKFLTNVVGRITPNLLFAATEFSITHNGLPLLGPQFSTPPHPPVTAESAAAQLDPLLVKLAKAMPDVSAYRCPHEGMYARMCAELRMHLYDPQQYASPMHPVTGTIDAGSLLLQLRAMHVQAIAIQHVARVLGWNENENDDGSEQPLVPFLQWKPRRCDSSEMVNSGVEIDELPLYLQNHHFNELKLKTDSNGAEWLADQWTKAGRPEIKRFEWDELLKKVGILTEESVYRWLHWSQL